MTAFRILSLDGGGIMGAFSARVLWAFDEICRQEKGEDLVAHFKLPSVGMS